MKKVYLLYVYNDDGSTDLVDIYSTLKKAEKAKKDLTIDNIWNPYANAESAICEFEVK